MKSDYAGTMNDSAHLTLFQRKTPIDRMGQVKNYAYLGNMLTFVQKSLDCTHGFRDSS